MILSDDDDIIHKPESDEEDKANNNNFNSNGLFIPKAQLLEEDSLNRKNTIGNKELD